MAVMLISLRTLPVFALFFITITADIALLLISAVDDRQNRAFSR